MMTITTKAEKPFPVPISLKRYFDAREEVGDQTTHEAIIRCFRRAVDFYLIYADGKPFELVLQSYSSQFSGLIHDIFRYLVQARGKWWCDVEEVVEPMVQTLIELQVVVARQRKLSLLAA